MNVYVRYDLIANTFSFVSETHTRSGKVDSVGTYHNQNGREELVHFSLTYVDHRAVVKT